MTDMKKKCPHPYKGSSIDYNCLITYVPMHVIKINKLLQNLIVEITKQTQS